LRGNIFGVKAFSIWVIGYGNPQRRDDGLGPYVASRLKEALKEKDEVLFHKLHQLEPDLAEDLREASLIIFVDATIKKVKGGWQWERVEPEPGRPYPPTHYIKPSFLLGMIESLYHQCPRAWLISIQGDDFSFGEGLSLEAEKRACQAITGIVNFIETEIFLLTSKSK